MATLSRTLSGLPAELEAALVTTARSEGKSVSAVAIAALCKQLLPALPVTDRAA